MFTSVLNDTKDLLPVGEAQRNVTTILLKGHNTVDPV